MRHLFVLAVLTAAGCAGSASPLVLRDLPVRSEALLRTARPQKMSPIKHVVFIVQENRSFNNLFEGYPGATTAKYGYDEYGNKIKIRARPLSEAWDIGHFSEAYFRACHGKGKPRGTNCRMDGWLEEGTVQSAPPDPEYSYVPRREIKPYWAMAQQYVLGDNTFASNLDGSFVSHQYIVAAYASSAVDFPETSWGCQGGRSDDVGTLTSERERGDSIRACFNNPTIASEADAAGVSWRFYAGQIYGDGGLWSSYQADKAIYEGPDWATNVINPPSQVLTDIASGKFAAITWITPIFKTSDHPGADASQGPAWVASIVDAIGGSKFWKSTAIFVFWDDWGGMFDPVPPPYEDYDGLGFRVPLIMISPYAKQGYVTHVRYETASVLRYMEDNFGLAPLAKADSRANDPANDAFDYKQPPRQFKKISGSEPAWYWREIERENAHLPRPHIIGDD